MLNHEYKSYDFHLFIHSFIYLFIYLFIYYTLSGSKTVNEGQIIRDE